MEIKSVDSKQKFKEYYDFFTKMYYDDAVEYNEHYYPMFNAYSKMLEQYEKDSSLLLYIEDKGKIVLTEKGRAVAENTYEKHCVISHWLMHIGVSRETAEEDACRMEHLISEETFQMMKKAVTIK